MTRASRSTCTEPHLAQLRLARDVLTAAAMRMLISLVSLLTVSACTAQEACNLLPVGSSMEGKKAGRISAQSDSVFRAMLSPAASAPYGRGTTLVWDKGPAEEAMCCATKAWGQPRPWCTPQQLDCTSKEMQSVTISVLAEPFSDQSRAPDDATFCFVAVHENTIIAIWHRYWS